jgi:hypothetical protein
LTRLTFRYLFDHQSQAALGPVVRRPLLEAVLASCGLGPRKTCGIPHVKVYHRTPRLHYSIIINALNAFNESYVVDVRVGKNSDCGSNRPVFNPSGV